MAAIDKTYISKWEDYQDIKSWCESCGTVTDDYGNKFRPIDFLTELTKDEWDEWISEQRENAIKNYDNPEHTAKCKELYGEDWTFNADNYCSIPIWNTPTYFDIWLIRNCPIEIIQDTLKEQYGSGWSKTAFNSEDERSDYDAIKEKISIYDTYQRNGLGKNTHFKIEWKYNMPFKDDELFWWISTDQHFWYNTHTDTWKHKNEPGPWSSNVCHMRGNISMRKLHRMLVKWNLPEGTVLRFDASYRNKFNQRYTVKEFKVTIKK